jgi:hypothetical protein
MNTINLKKNMTQLKLKFKKILCKHTYKPIANIYGELKEDFNGCTVLSCTKCHKLKYVKDYIEAPFNYNMILLYKLHKNNGTLTDELKSALLNNICKNNKEYIDMISNI